MSGVLLASPSQIVGPTGRDSETAQVVASHLGRAAIDVKLGARDIAGLVGREE